MKKRATNILEDCRKLLGITRDEYALCDYVRYRCADPRQKKDGWCKDAKDEIADFVGITRPGLYKMIARMKDQDLLEISPDGSLRVTEKWIDSEASCKLSLHKNSGDSVNIVDSPRKLNLQKTGSECKQSLQTPYKEDNSLVGTSNDNSENEFPNPNEVNSKTQKGNQKKEKVARKEKGPGDPAIQKMVLAFEAEHKKHFKDAMDEWIGFTWQSKEFPALVSIKKELEKRFPEKMGRSATEKDILASFETFLTGAATCDKWVLENLFSPSKLWSQFQTIIEKIHESNNRKRSSSADRPGRRSAATESLVRRAAGESWK